MNKNTISWNEVLANPEVKAEYDLLECEFSLMRKLIALRGSTGLTQREFAKRVGMKQSQLARIESGKQIPKLETLAKLAASAGYAIEIRFIPNQENEAGKIKRLPIIVADVEVIQSTSDGNTIKNGTEKSYVSAPTEPCQSYNICDREKSSSPLTP
jgi:transcriptional regulator with XRE-family HTH domain